MKKGRDVSFDRVGINDLASHLQDRIDTVFTDYCMRCQDLNQRPIESLSVGVAVLQDYLTHIARILKMEKPHERVHR